LEREKKSRHSREKKENFEKGEDEKKIRFRKKTKHALSNIHTVKYTYCKIYCKVYLLEEKREKEKEKDLFFVAEG